jgi:hypothetical protein
VGVAVARRRDRRSRPVRGGDLMPAKSDRQRRYLYAKFGAAWVKRHHFERVESAKSRQGGRRLRQVARKSAR